MTAPSGAGLRLRSPGATRWQSRAFGLDLDLGFAARGLPRTPTHPSGPVTRVDLVYADSLEASWPKTGARRTGMMGPAERPVMTVDEHPDAGYLIHLWPYGRYLVTPDGLSIACAPPAVGWWYWQRLLIGQVLPAASALRGYETLHASAVRIGDRGAAFVGEPGAGKTSIATRLVRSGATLIAEDVASVVDVDGAPMIEPGSAMINLTENEAVEHDLSGLGEVVGRSHGKVHVIANREEHVVPLSVLYMLEPTRDELPTFERLTSVKATDLFAHMFVTYIHRADRMVRQLDLASLIARTVPVFRLRIRPHQGSAEIASAVREHVGSL